MKNFEHTDGETFESSLDTAIKTIREYVVLYSIPEKQQFQSSSLRLIYSQVYKHDLANNLQ